ncbi:MAG: DUF2188 domain-containing protein [Candidatus Doudnabacteria bacterium]|nr:DUF2188 domain-containing protein [Candidatus Doudnabacteria bacterium]
MANQHIVYRGHNEWAVRREKASRDTIVVDNQQEAFDIARDIAENQGGEVFIHGRDGKIRERNTYKDDPYPPKG